MGHRLPEDCRAQLALILDSADFEATGRERRFLNHVVEETLSGRSDRIKTYSVILRVGTVGYLPHRALNSQSA